MGVEPKKFRFTDEQRRFIKSDADRLLYSGSVHSGKTFVGCAKGLLLSLQYPSNRGLIVRKDFTSLRETTLQTLLQGDPETKPVIPPENILNHNKSEHRIKIATQGDPSTIIYSGLDTSKKGSDYPSKVGSSQYGWIFVDECVELKKEDWLFLESRLRHPVDFKQIFGATNPSHPEHWLYEMFYKRSQDPHSEVIEANVYDNPFVSEDYLRRLEETYTGPMRERLLKGKWTASSGLVYPNFEPSVHKKDISSDRRYKKVVVGADAGFTNPRALVVIGISGDDKYWVLDEFYRTRTGVKEAIEWLKEWERTNRYSIYKVYHDPSSPEDIERFNQSGFNCVGANNDIISGISSVNELLGNFETGDGSRVEPRLFVDDRCENLVNEFLSYSYPDSDKETPIKQNDHLLDALRYAVIEEESQRSGPDNRFMLKKRGERGSKTRHIRGKTIR